MTPSWGGGGITSSLLPADLLGALTQGCEQLSIRHQEAAHRRGVPGAFPARSVTMVAG